MVFGWYAWLNKNLFLLCGVNIFGNKNEKLSEVLRGGFNESGLGKEWGLT